MELLSTESSDEPDCDANLENVATSSEMLLRHGGGMGSLSLLLLGLEDAMFNVVMPASTHGIEIEAKTVVGVGTFLRGWVGIGMLRRCSFAWEMLKNVNVFWRERLFSLLFFLLTYAQPQSTATVLIICCCCRCTIRLISAQYIVDLQ